MYNHSDIVGLVCVNCKLTSKIAWTGFTVQNRLPNPLVVYISLTDFRGALHVRSPCIYMYLQTEKVFGFLFTPICLIVCYGSKICRIPFFLLLGMPRERREILECMYARCM